MDRAKNLRGQIVTIGDACVRPSGPYVCPGINCRHTLILRKHGSRKCFAHRPLENPACEYRADSDDRGGAIPHGDDDSELNEVGTSLVNAFLTKLRLRGIPEGDAFLDSDDVTRAQLQLLKLVVGLEFLSYRAHVDVANIMAWLTSSELAGCLRQILAAWIRNGHEKTKIENMRDLLLKSARDINWGECFPAVGQRSFLPDPWTHFSDVSFR